MNILLYVVLAVRSFNVAREQSRRAGVPLMGRILSAFGMMLVMLSGLLVGLFGAVGVMEKHPNLGVASLIFAGVWFIGCFVWMIRWGKRDTANINARIAANEALAA